MTIAPDHKDWTWVLERRCDQCGFDAASVPSGELSGRLLASSGAWVEELASNGGARQRPDDSTWSPLEYGCHVRDVHILMAGRLRRMVEEDHPDFEEWDQNEVAVRERYGEQEPEKVAAGLVDAGRAGAELLAAVCDDDWVRPGGRRANGEPFTVESLGRYWLHDVEHHLHDVQRSR